MTTPHPYDALLIEAAGLRARIAELEHRLAVERARAKFLDAECARRLGLLKESSAEICELEANLADARSETVKALERAVELEAEVARLRGDQAPADDVYQNQCCDCQGVFLGPKRAIVCSNCRDAQLPARVRMDPQPPDWPGIRLEPSHGRIFKWFGVSPKSRAITCHEAPSADYIPVEGPDGTWYWELPVQEGGKP